MRVSVRYFASIRETLDRTGETVETGAVTLAGLRGGAYAESLARGRAVRLALNQVMADESALLVEGAEVGFFPPVTGG